MGNPPLRSRAGRWPVATGLAVFAATVVILTVFALHILPAVLASPDSVARASTSLGAAESEQGEPHASGVSPDIFAAPPDEAWQLADWPASVATACPAAPARSAVPQAIAAPLPQAGVTQVCPVEAASSATLVRYTVRTGDTLFGLARRFGTTVEAISAANNLPSCTIFVCQELLIPVGACPGECTSVSVPAASVPVVSAPVCPTLCPPIAAPACPTVCPPACPTVVRAAVIAPICPAALPTPLPIPIRPGASQPCLVVHVVQPGEDLFHIAIRYKVNVAVLMQVNYLSAAAVKVGQTLLIP